jgi:hypothetical protein
VRIHACTRRRSFRRKRARREDVRRWSPALEGTEPKASVSGTGKSFGVSDRSRLAKLTCVQRSITPTQVSMASESGRSPRQSLVRTAQGGTTQLTCPAGAVADTPREAYRGGLRASLDPEHADGRRQDPAVCRCRSGRRRSVLMARGGTQLPRSPPCPAGGGKGRVGEILFA